MWQQLIKILRRNILKNCGKKRKDLHANWSTRLSRADSTVSRGYVFHSDLWFAIYVARGYPPPAWRQPDQISSSAPDRRSRDTRGNAGNVVIYVPKQVARVGHKFVFIGRSAWTARRGLACKYLSTKTIDSHLMTEKGGRHRFKWSAISRNANFIVSRRQLESIPREIAYFAKILKMVTLGQFGSCV